MLTSMSSLADAKGNEHHICLCDLNLTRVEELVNEGARHVSLLLIRGKLLPAIGAWQRPWLSNLLL